MSVLHQGGGVWRRVVRRLAIQVAGSALCRPTASYPATQQHTQCSACHSTGHRQRGARSARLGVAKLDDGDLAVLDDPLLVGDLGNEGLVVRDGDDGALEILESGGQRG